MEQERAEKLAELIINTLIEKDFCDEDDGDFAEDEVTDILMREL